ncbi:NAD(P)-binding domain-containing protein [Actinomadura gamaensis]|uniref:NAD(P)-binding domain-containing protein n=1 Tax=Actinomadura gamaensis TaxID=1763541 RepID=A0ABV9U2F9_9ACTN
MPTSLADAVVVGAGPYGLSAAAHLRGAGLDCRIIGTPMHFWNHHMPAGMFLKSEPFASSLSSPADGTSFLDYRPGWRAGRPIPVDTFASYGEWFTREAGLPAEPATVTSVERADGRFEVALETGETISTPNVVLGIGMGVFADLPAELRHLPGALCGHSSEYRDLSVFKGARVAVVGAGQSALETAVLLAEQGAEPVLITRTPALKWNAAPSDGSSPAARLLRGPQSGLGRGYRTWVWSERPEMTRLLPDRVRARIVRNTLGPAGAWWLRDRFATGIAVRTGQRLSGADATGDRVTLTTADRSGDLRVLTVDHVLAATGFTPDVDRVQILSPEIRREIARTGRSPKLDSAFGSSVPGLYFTGLAAAASFGPVMRFVHGADFCARRIARRLGQDRR